MAKTKLIVGVGAALGTLLGSVALAIYRNEILDTLRGSNSDISDWAKSSASSLLDKGRELIGLRTAQDELSSQIGRTIAGVTGAAVGAGLALFLTPKSGKQLRNQLQRVYDDLFRRTKVVVKELRNNSHPVITKVHKTKRPKRVVVKAR